MTTQQIERDVSRVKGSDVGEDGFDIRTLLSEQELHQPALRQVTLMVRKHGGVNLSQGTCELPTPKVVKEGAKSAIDDERDEGTNRYCPADGIPELREALVSKLNVENHIPCKFENVAVTSGSTGGLESILGAFLRDGDEVVMFEPGYPYHRNMVENGHKGRVRMVPLRAPDWTFDLDELARAITSRTKFVLITNPGNPTGKVFSREELTAIGAICRNRRVMCVTDEVYEYLTYDGRTHVSMASLPGMFDHTITLGSYSKTFAITGWRIGYLCAPAKVYDNLRVKSDQKYICPQTPGQYGVLRGIQSLGREYHTEQLRAYTERRQLLCDALEAAGFAVYRPQGAYYVIADTSTRFPGLSSEQVAFDELIRKAAPGRAIGAVPASDFLGRQVYDDPTRSNFLRFCFALTNEKLERAACLLKALRA